MDTLRKLTPKTLWMGPLVAAMLLAGCAGIEPYEPRNYRQDGLENGLITGSEGEFVIYRKPSNAAAGSETRKNPEETADGEEQKDGK